MKTYEFNVQSLIIPVVFFTGGIVMAYYDLWNGFSLSGYLILALFIPGVIIYYLYTRFSFALTGYLACLVLFFLTGYGHTTLLERSYERYSTHLGENLNPTGKVTDIAKYASMDRISVRIPVTDWWAPSHHFIINLMEKNSSIREGQTIRLSRPLYPIESNPIPFHFRAKEYWKLKNTSHSIFLYNASNIEVVHEEPVSFIKKTRQLGLNRVETLFPNPEQSGILKALLLGKTDDVTKEVKSDFKTSGLLHILAVSGLHVGIVSGLLFFLLFPAKFLLPYPWLHYSLIIGALWVYAALTGMNIPVVRAVILMTFYLTSRRIYRQSNKWNIYFWAMLIVLILDPKSLFSVSFQLSFGAVGSILLYYRHINRWLRHLIGQTYFTSLIAVSLAAQIGVFPILLWHFQQASLISTISSLLVIPLLFPLILTTALAILIPPNLDWLVHIFTTLSQTIVNLLLGLSEMMGGWSFASEILVWNNRTLVALLLAILVGGLILEYRKYITYRWITLVPAGLLSLALVFESLNIYQKRNNAILNVLEYQKTPFIELYASGICYTNFIDQAPDFLLRLRAKYHTRKTVRLEEDEMWRQLLNQYQQNTPGLTDLRRRHFVVNDFIQQESLIFDLRDVRTAGDNAPINERVWETVRTVQALQNTQN